MLIFRDTVNQNAPYTTLEIIVRTVQKKKETNKISRNFGVKKLLIKSTSIAVKFLYILEKSFEYNLK